MSVIACPRCNEAVRVPESVTIGGDTALNGSVRCPWCHETMAVSDVVSRLPPLLEIVALDDAGLEVSDFGTADLGSSATPEVAIAGEEFASFEPHDHQEEFGEYQLADPIQAVGPSIAPAGRATAGGRSRARSKNGSGIGAVIKMALGGLMAIPIAAVILSLLGRPLPIDLGFFPFEGDGGTAPASRIAAAPARPQAEPKPSSASRKMKPQQSRVIAPVADRGAANKDLGNKVPGNENPVNENVSLADAALAEIQNTEGLQDGGLAMPEFPLESTTTISSEPPIMVDERKQDVGSKDTESLDSILGTKDEELVLSATLVEAITTAEDAVGEAVDLFAVDAIDKKVFQDAYRKVAEVAALLDVNTAKHESVRDLINKVGSSSKLSSMYTDVGPRWPGVKSRRTDGILLIGESMNSAGSQQINFGNDRKLTVQFDTALPKGRVIALGRLLDEGERIELLAVESVK
jgi:hypothetical protein